MKKIIIGLLLAILIFNIGFLILYKPKTGGSHIGQAFTINELSKFDGTDPSLPIYLAYNGDVYDVTAGKSFYDSQGTYHYLAGKDSTVELNFAGGGIIKTKYKIIGYLVK